MEPVPTDSNDATSDPSQQDASAEDQPVDGTKPQSDSAQPPGDTEAGSPDTDSSTDGTATSESISAEGSPDQPAKQETVKTVSQEDVDALLTAANGDAGSTVEDPKTDGSKTVPFDMPDLDTPTESNIDPKRVTMLNDVNLRVRIELGRTKMLVEDVLKLGKGSVVELDKLAGDPVDVFVNDRLIARGEVLVLNDNFCVRINEVLSHDPHRVSA